MLTVLLMTVFGLCPGGLKWKPFGCCTQTYSTELLLSIFLREHLFPESVVKALYLKFVSCGFVKKSFNRLVSSSEEVWKMLCISKIKDKSYFLYRFNTFVIFTYIVIINIILLYNFLSFFKLLPSSGVATAEWYIVISLIIIINTSCKSC